LVFVQLPSATAADGAGGSLAAHVVDGIRYAMECVPEGKPLVVSISYGNLAGPHDGRSMVESALSDLLASRPRMAVVVAAGNARQAEAHARRTVRRNNSVLLRLDVVAGDTTESFVEAWYPQPGPKLQARARTPQGVWSDWIGQGQAQQLADDATLAHPQALVAHHGGPSVHGGGARVLLALAPTGVSFGVVRGAAPAGEWHVEFRLDPVDTSGEDTVAIEAWIEREDPVREAGGRHTRFIDQLRDDELGTWAAWATTPGIVRAGGFNLGTDKPAPYSSLANRADPELFVLAACEEDAVNPNIAAAATRSFEQYRMSGTSVAAPVLARRLYEYLSQPGEGKPSLQQALDDLTDGRDPVLKPYRRD
jgi:hypothetical protein